MGFDAFMLRAAAWEIDKTLSGARVEKVLQPSKDEVFLAMHKDGSHFRLHINAGASAARIGITRENPENPKVPPMFCMLLRKHLTGARLIKAVQKDFERVMELEFETYDEMGFLTVRRLICEIMGRYSNAVLCDADYKILNVLRPVDFTTSSKRQLLPQMRYEYPPAQDKKDPLCETPEGFMESVTECDGNTLAKELMSIYAGMSPLTAGEIVFRARAAFKDEKEALSKTALCGAFFDLVCKAKEHRYDPTLIIGPDGQPFEFSPFDITQYGDGESDRKYKKIKKATLGEITDGYFAERERASREKQRAHDTERLLKNVENRLVKKLELQSRELKDTEKKADYKNKADLITANIYRFSGKTDTVTVIDYVEDGEGGYTEKEVELKLERGLTPAQNAQKLYKKYNKAKNAETEIKAQIEKGSAELEYIRSVRDALGRISGQADLEEIQRELVEAGYDRTHKRDISSKNSGGGKVNGKVKGKNQSKTAQPRSPEKHVTSGGFTVYVGKNNLQNDYLTFRLSGKNDYWFHVKNRPGSHTVLVCDGEEPSERDLTEAAELAAFNSRAAGEERVEVDYTRIRNVKKPSGSRPGYVIYEGYNTAVVSAKGKGTAE